MSECWVSELEWVSEEWVSEEWVSEEWVSEEWVSEEWVSEWVTKSVNEWVLSE